MGGTGRFLGNSSIVAVVAMAAGCAVSAPAAAQARSYSLPEQEATSAIPEFGRQSGVQILANRDDLIGKRTRAVNGRLSIDAALGRLLRGTGLRGSFDARAGVVSIRRVTAGPAPRTADSGASRPSTPVVSPAPDASGAAAPDVVVTGSRLAQAGNDTPAPVNVFDRERIAQLGANGVGDVLRNLPQETFATVESFTFAGSQGVQLRGLGLGTTLVLINGRRTVSSALQGGRGFFDINVIPLAAVDRVEVLSSSSSAVYGSDAVGGVVNIMLKKRIDRPSVDLYYGFTPDGDGEEKRASLSFGINGPRLRSAFTFDYFKREPLFGRDREMVANADFRRFGSTDARAATANPGNVYSTTAANLPGLNSTFAGVPANSTGVGLTPADFVATAGIANLDTLARFTSIVPESRRISGMASLEYDITDGITAFGEFMYVDRREEMTQPPPVLANLTVPVANPFNPFRVPVRVNTLLSGLGVREQVSTSQFYRAVAGFKGAVGKWHWELAGLLTRDDAVDLPVRALDTARVTAALASTDPAQALNPFKAGAAASDAVLQSLYAAQIRNDYQSDSRQIGGFVSGPLFALRGGNVEVVVGGEVRSEGIIFNSNPTIHLDVDRSTEAAFAELRVPLVNAGMNVPLVRDLTLRAAGRYDHYSDFGGTTNPELGLTWTVVPGLLLRGSYGESFRAPSLFELYSPQVSTSQVAQIIDPRRRSESYRIDVVMGGNASLMPERAKSRTLGIVLNPRALPGFHASLDYFNVSQDFRVQRFSTGVVIANEALFPSRVTRLPATAADIAAGFPGRVQLIDARSANFGSVSTDGFDLAASYRIDTPAGIFTPNVAATYVRTFKDALTPGSAPIDRAGRANLSGSVPEWRATAGLSWNLDGWRSSISGRYTGSYDDVNFTGVLTGKKVEARMLVDTQISYSFDRDTAGPLRGMTFRAGAINLFNAAPSFSRVLDVNGLGYDPSQADLRQRFVYVALSKAF